MRGYGISPFYFQNGDDGRLYNLRDKSLVRKFRGPDIKGHKAVPGENACVCPDDKSVFVISYEKGKVERFWVEGIKIAVFLPGCETQFLCVDAGGCVSVYEMNGGEEKERQRELTVPSILVTRQNSNHGAIESDWE